MLNNRIKRVREITGDGVSLISNKADIFYLSGFTGSSALLLIGEKDKYIISDFRYREQIAEQCEEYEFVLQRSGETLYETAAKLIKKQFVSKSIFFEEAAVHYSDYMELLDSGLLRPIPFGKRIGMLRARKDEAELTAIRESARIADAVAVGIVKEIVPGVTEEYLAKRVNIMMLEMGADKLSFDTIIAFGPNAAKPHHMPSKAKLGEHGFVVLDMGCVAGGYCSDITRTYCLGKPDDEQIDVYNVVLEAQSAALNGIEPGMTGKEADAIARDVIKKNGFEGYFGHGLGHGVGIEVHENPRLNETSEHVLEEGMVFSIEPGVYLPGKCGVRIEDLCIMGRDGVETLYKAPKDIKLNQS